MERRLQPTRATGTGNPTGDGRPVLSIVLPVLNEARDIGRLLGELQGQAVPPGGIEVLVVDGGSTDGTREIVGNFNLKWPAVRLLDNPRRRSSAGRNIGVEAARGLYVLFLDGHCALTRNDYLLRTIELFESTKAECLCRPQPFGKLIEGGWAGAISRARGSWLGHYPGSDIYGGGPAYTDPRSAGAAYVRACLVDLGGFDERFDACEDLEFNYRVSAAGYRSYRHPDLSVEYRPRSTLGALYRQMIRYGKGRAHVMVRHPAVFPWPLILPTLLLMGGVLFTILRGPRVGGPMVAALIVLWLIMIAFEGIRLAGPTLGGLRISLALLTVHVGLVLGFWRGAADCRRYRSAYP